MSAHAGTTLPLERNPARVIAEPVAADADRYEGIEQYSLGKIVGVWAAAAVPMGVLAWIVAPWLRDQLGGDEPLAQALLICLTAGLIWQFVLVLLLLKRELGELKWSRVRDALWLRAPRDPKTGGVDGIFLNAYPARRHQSAWMGIIVHSSQSIFLIAVVLALVLA
jgi:hypothetical protein